MEMYNVFTEWALARGVKLDGIAIHRFSGRGVGIIATKDLEAGDAILIAPLSALRTAYTVPRNISRSIGAISVNGLLAAELAIDTTELRAPWRAVLPTKTSFEELMPLMWHPSLQALLPPESLSLLKKQREKVSLDWDAVSTAFPTLSYDLYVYHWLIVSTRTFFYTSPKAKAKKPLTHDDCLALIPFADNFNHADVGCEVTFSQSGYRFCADRQIKEGEEIFINYGSHSNDFLLTEYGFILAENKWDTISLDEILLVLFSEEQKQELKAAGFFGKFILDKVTFDYRTQIAIRLLCVPPNEWRHLVANGLDDNDKYQVAVDQVLLKVMKSFLDVVDERLKQIEVLEGVFESSKTTLTSRWEQIQLLLAAATGRIEGKTPPL